MTLRIWGELVPCTEFIETTHPEKMEELWVRVKYSPILKNYIEGHIDYIGTFAHTAYLSLIDDPTQVFEYKDMDEFLLEWEKYHGN